MERSLFRRSSANPYAYTRVTGPDSTASQVTKSSAVVMGYFGSGVDNRGQDCVIHARRQARPNRRDGLYMRHIPTFLYQ